MPPTPRTLSPHAEAVKTVDPERAVGKPHTLWVAFAKLYERHGDLPNARIIFEKAVQVRLGVEGFGLRCCKAVDVKASCQQWQPACLPACILQHPTPPTQPPLPPGPLQVRGRPGLGVVRVG